MRQLKHHEQKLLKKVKYVPFLLLSDFGACVFMALFLVHGLYSCCARIEQLSKTIHNLPSSFLNYKNDGNLREIQVMRRYHITDRDDYKKLNQICGMVTKLVHTLKRLDTKDETRIDLTEKVLEKYVSPRSHDNHSSNPDSFHFCTIFCRLYDMGVITTKKSLVQLEKLSTASFCRRRLSVIMVRLKMAENLREAVTFIEQGHVRVGPDTITEPAYLVTRSLEDFVTWVDTSKIKRKVLQYNDKLDDYDLLD